MLSALVRLAPYCLFIAFIARVIFLSKLNKYACMYTVFQKSDAKIQIAITTGYLIRINLPLSNFNYRLSGTNIANFNKLHRTVSKNSFFKMELKNIIFQYGKYRLAHLLQKVL